MANNNQPGSRPALTRRSGAIWIVGPLLAALAILAIIFVWPTRERVTPGDRAGAPAPAAMNGAPGAPAAQPRPEPQPAQP